VKLLKRIAWLALAGLVLLVAGVWLLGGRAARAAVERAGTQALGVETRLASLDLGILSGKLGLEELSVANPAGFGTPHFLTLGEGRLEVSLGTLTSNRIEVPLLELSGLELSLEKRTGRTNYGAILDHLQRMSSAGADAKEPAEKGTGKSFLLREVVLRDVHAHVDLLPEGGELTVVDVSLPELRLHDIGEGGAPLASIVGEIVQALLAAVVEAGAGRIPDAVLGELEAGLAQISQGARELGERAGQVLEDIGAPGALEGVSGAVEGAVKEAGGLLDKVLGGKD
jgi:hypothetical protein